MDRHTNTAKWKASLYGTIRPAAGDLPKLWRRGRGVYGRPRFAIAFILCAVVGGVIHLDGGFVDYNGTISLWVYDCILDLEGPESRDAKRVVVVVTRGKKIVLSSIRISQGGSLVCSGWSSRCSRLA